MSIIKCSCKHAYQDSIYGYGNRVATPMRSGQLKCTVCSTVHGTASLTKAKVKEPVVTKEVTKAPEQKAKTDEKSSGKDDKKKSLKGGKR